MLHGFVKFPSLLLLRSVYQVKRKMNTPTETKGQFAQEAETEIFYKRGGKSATFQRSVVLLVSN